MGRLAMRYGQELAVTHYQLILATIASLTPFTLATAFLLSGEMVCLAYILYVEIKMIEVLLTL